MLARPGSIGFAPPSNRHTAVSAAKERFASAHSLIWTRRSPPRCLGGRTLSSPGPHNDTTSRLHANKSNSVQIWADLCQSPPSPPPVPPLAQRRSHRWRAAEVGGCQRLRQLRVLRVCRQPVQAHSTALALGTLKYHFPQSRRCQSSSSLCEHIKHRLYALALVVSTSALVSRQLFRASSKTIPGLRLQARALGTCAPAKLVLREALPSQKGLVT